MAWFKRRKEHLGRKADKTDPPPRDRLAEMTKMFGPFAPAFLDYGLKAPGYMILLNLNDHDGDLNVVLDRISNALALREAEQWRASLLEDADWRPHLVGALAALLAEDPAPYIPLLWRAIDGGSWVTPQLVATARLIDPDFYTRAVSRVQLEAPVSEPQGLSMLERHSACGPAGTAARQGKLMACLLALCDKTHAQEWIRKAENDDPDATLTRNVMAHFDAIENHEWAQQVRKQPAIASILAADFDGSDEITLGWLVEVQEVLRKRRSREIGSGD